MPPKYRLQAKKLFLTFPQCPLPKYQAEMNLTFVYGEQLLWYIIAKEAHEDGSPHLHLALEFKEKFTTTKQDAFDFVGEKHGNYQAMKNQLHCVKYVTKGGNYISKGIDVEAILTKKSGKHGEVAKLVMEGKSLEDINHENPGYVLNNKRKLEEYISWIQKRSLKQKLTGWTPIPQADLVDMEEQDQRIGVWLNNNIKREREFRQAQLYIHGPPKTGKSSFLGKLSSMVSIYWVPRDEDFYDDYENGVYDLAVFDEFTHTKTMQWMNSFLDGSKTYLKQKGRQVLKMDNLPVIICSNYTLEQNYPKLYEAAKLEPLLSRVEVVEVKDFISVLE